ncbi:MAG TPA: NADAR family protein [Coleofasciculaceae cyanobacterium]
MVIASGYHCFKKKLWQVNFFFRSFLSNLKRTSLCCIIHTCLMLFTSIKVLIMGSLFNFYLPYKDESGNNLSASDQALAIIAEAQKLISRGSCGVAITYSANYAQTVAIHKTYESGRWNTNTSGANQAAVMQVMESLMADKYSTLQRRLQIAPITTMTYSDYGGHTHQQVVESDLEYIKSLLDKGWDVLAWQNQSSIPGYAIGGGIATLPKEIDTLIQMTLVQYAVDYPGDAPNEPIKFYHLDQPYGCFSNFAPYAVYLKDRIWPTSEHYFQAQKFMNTCHEEEIRQAKTAREAAEMGRDCRRPLRQGWDGIKDDVMREALYAKFTQHPDLTQKLLATGDLKLIEHTKNDRYWGDGGDGTGLNRLGHLLMETRKRIHYDFSNGK